MFSVVARLSVALAGGTQGAIVANLNTIKNNIPTQFGNLRFSLGTLQMGYGINQASNAGGLQDNILSGWFASTFQENLAGSNLFGSSGVVTSTINNVVQQLLILGSTTVNNPGFVSACYSFEVMLADPSIVPELFASAILSLLEGLIILVLDTTISTVTIIANIVQTIITEISNLLNRELYIPVISEVYQKFVDPNGGTLLDILSFLIAAPASVIYRLATGNAPFSLADVVTMTSPSAANSNASQKWDKIKNVIDTVVSTQLALLTALSDSIEAKKTGNMTPIPGPATVFRPTEANALPAPEPGGLVNWLIIGLSSLS